MTSLQKRLLFFSCLILVIGLMAMDFINPSLPFVMKELQVSQNETKGLMVVYMMTLGLAQFFYGTYSETQGRKKAILLSIFIAIIGFIVSAASTTIMMLYIGRFLTALGTAGCPVIARALIADAFPDNTQLKQAFSYFSMSSQFSPALAPVLGGVIQHYLNWHWSFMSLAFLNTLMIIAIILQMPESHEQSGPKMPFVTQIKLYSQLAKHTQFMIFNLQSALIFVFTIGFYSLSPFIFHALGYTALQNGLFYSVYAIGIVLGAWSLASGLKQMDARKTFRLSLILYFGLFSAFAIAFSFIQAAWLIIVFSFILGFICGVAAPLTLFLCMQGFKENKGAASAMQSFVKMFFTGVVLLACNFFQLSNFSQLMLIFLSISLIMMAFYRLEKYLSN